MCVFDKDTGGEKEKYKGGGGDLRGDKGGAEKLGLEIK